MPKPTIQELLIAGLTAHGWKEVPSRSGKYLTFEKPSVRFLLFVGRSGALRAGRTATTSRSMDGTPFREGILSAGHDKLSPPLISIPELDFVEPTSTEPTNG